MQLVNVFLVNIAHSYMIKSLLCYNLQLRINAIKVIMLHIAHCLHFKVLLGSPQ